MTLREFEQAVWEDLRKLESRSVEFVQDANLRLPIVNKHGDILNLKHDDGRLLRTWNSHGYKSAAWDYDP